VVLFGGGAQLSPDVATEREPRWLRDLWEWDGERWMLLASSGPPSNGGQPGFVHDRARNRLVLFGGGNLPGTWEWTGRSWSRVR
jgi:hypothetical protein